MFYIYIILGLLLLHCTMYYLNIDVFNLLSRSKSDSKYENDNVDVDNGKVNNTNVGVSIININDDLSTSIETSINELKNLNQYIDNELGQTSFC
jgi:hypothetical protein